MCLNRFIIFPPVGGPEISIFFDPVIFAGGARFARFARFADPTGARSWCRCSLCLLDPSGGPSGALPGRGLLVYRANCINYKNIYLILLA
jgi:hypothetical protein